MSAKSRTCRLCGKDLPENADNFKRLRGGKLDTRCLLCRREALRGKRNKERLQTLQDVEVGALGTFLREANQGGENIPHSAEVLERLMEYFGGVSGFSGLFAKHYFDSPPWGSTRTKMLEAMLRLVVKNTEQGGAKKPMTQWTDEELEEELDSRLRRVAAQYKGLVLYAPQEKTPAALPAPKRKANQQVPSGRAEEHPGGDPEPQH
jgi:hypothetical protein